MDDSALSEFVAAATAAAAFAADVRATHRKRTLRGNRQREADLNIALKRLQRAMRPIRSELARAPYRKAGTPTTQQHQTLLEASKVIQRERRKLWKMQKRKEPSRGKSRTRR